MGKTGENSPENVSIAVRKVTAHSSAGSRVGARVSRVAWGGASLGRGTKISSSQYPGSPQVSSPVCAGSGCVVTGLIAVIFTSNSRAENRWAQSGSQVVSL